MFVSTAITFWTTDYLVKVLKFNGDEAKNVFITLSLTSPILGIILGGLFVQKVFKGYESKNSILFVCIMLLIGSCLVPLVYFQSELIMFGVVLWLLLFFGSSTLPTIQGISISSLPKKLRSSGNSLYNLLMFTFGFSPGPFVYGFLYDRTNNIPKLAYTVTLSWCFIGLIFAIICAFFRYGKFRDPNSQENKNIKEIMQEQ